MSPEEQPAVAKWYVLNHIASAIDRNSACKAIDRYNQIHDSAIEIFAPTHVVREERNGAIRLKKARLTFHYVFVRGSFDQIKALCADNNGFSFVINRSSDERYASISDNDMQAFRIIARAYENCLPYFSLTDIDLEDGDIVEVINGDFPGLIGTYMPRPKSKTGNIVLRVTGQIGAIAYNIKVSDVRVIEFSKNSTRANDQIDAFVPQLLKALRHHRQNQPLPRPLAANLDIFCRRMDRVKLPGNKLQAKLQALLMGANTILGRTDTAAIHRARLEKLRPTITNPWTEQLVNLITNIIDSEPVSPTPQISAILATLRPTAPAPRSTASAHIAAPTPTATASTPPLPKGRRLLLDELLHYTNP